jgi:hypothetical protein
MVPESFDSSGLSSYFRELAETPEPVIPSSTLLTEFNRACGPWVSLTAAAAKCGFALGNVMPAGPVIDLVLALSGVGDAQTELLKSIKADTLLLRREPLQTAVTLMNEAKRVGPGDERWAQFLYSAIDSLYQAIGLSKSPEERAIVQLGLACAYLTLDKPRDARHWIEESVESERAALNTLLWECRDVVNVPYTIGEISNLLESYFPYDAPSAFEKFLLRLEKIRAQGGAGVRAGKELLLQGRIETLRRFLYFANAVEICAAAICGGSETKILDLIRRGTPLSDSRWSLREKSLAMPTLRSPYT